ncbi:MAG: DUF5979 domain-containing protein, partial [Actinomycetes bacterium]
VYQKASSPATVNITDFGCDPGVAPASVRFTYTGVDGGGNGTISPNAAGQLDLHGTAAGVTSQDVADGLLNCFDAHATTPQSSSSAALACKTVVVQNPSSGIGNVVKGTSGVNTIVPGQPMKFDLSFKNTGNVPVTDAYIVDPVDPTALPNAFTVVQLSSITVSSTPASVIEVWDPTPATGLPRYVTYVPSDAALKARATGLRVRVTGAIPVGSTFRVTYYVTVRDGVAFDTTFSNCAAVGIGQDPPGVPACSGTITVKPASASASLDKKIEPMAVLRPEPGLPTQKAQVKHAINNNGPAYFQSMTFTDVNTGFFDAVTFAGNMNVNFPPGANRVRVDACTTDCAGGTFVNGVATASATPGLPAGVAAADVQGIRVTFSNSNNGYELIPGKNLPSGGACKLASFCFDVTARQFLRSNPTEPIPSDLTDTSDGQAVTSLPTPGTVIPIPLVSAPLTINNGAAVIKLTKGPTSRLGPGDSAPFDLLLENTGTTAIVAPIITDPLPDNLTLVEDPPGGTPGRPFVITYPALPSGYPPLPSADVQYTVEHTAPDPNRITKVTWAFTHGGTDWTLPPGGKVNIRIYVQLTPGTPADQTITNTSGAHGSNSTISCDAGNPSVTDDPTYGSGLYCLSSANIVSLAGNAVNPQKWSAGDDALGFYNAITGQVVPTTDLSCPHFIHGGRTYTKYPCAATVNPGGTMLNLIRMTNSGTTDLVSAVAVDGLPVQGDTGVLLSGDSRGTQWNNRPTMLTPVTVEGGYPGVTTDYTANTFPGPSFCTTQLQSPPVACPPNAYNAGFSEYVTGFRTTMDLAADPLQPGESIILTWTMATPLSLTTTTTMPTAWNSFAQESTFAGGVVGQATEPLKTGVVMRFGTVVVSKTVVGLPPGITVPDFTMEYSCTVDGQEISSGSLTITEGTTVALPLQPTGAQCAVWETNANGASSPNEGQANAAIVTVPDPNTTPAGVTVPIVNTYQNGQITVTKQVSGDAAPLPWQAGGTVGGGTFAIDVSCEFPAVNGTLLPGFPVTLNLAGGQSQVLGLNQGYSIPAGSLCTIHEGDN